MKVYTKVVWNSDGEIIEEDSYEYDGPVDECKGGGTKTEYTQSPEQAAVYREVIPLIRRMSRSALGTPAQPGWWGAPATPAQPGGQQVWDVGAPPAADYQIPSTESMMPSKQWWGGISPEVKEGLWAPWNEAAGQMMEKMGGSGQLGSARGGYSGTGERALGEFYSKAGQNVGLQAWQMTQPAMKTGWAAEYDKTQQDYANQMTQWGLEQEAIQYPYKSLPGLMGGTYSQGVTTPTQGSGTASALGGGAVGAGLGGYLASGTALGGPLGAVLGGAAGIGASLLGGK